MATTPPPLLHTASQSSLGAIRMTKEVMSDQFLASEESAERKMSIANQINLVSPRSIPGPCHSSNKGCISWGPQGSVAYGAHMSVVVIDALTLQPTQCFLRNKAVIKRVLWCPQDFGRLRVVSADTVGNIVLWDIVEGVCEISLQEGNKPVLDLDWAPETGFRSCSKILPCLVALHSPYSLVLWDLNKGVKLWKKTFTESLLSFCFDPFNSSHLAFLCPDCILFVDDFNVKKEPNSNGRQFYISSPRLNDAEDTLKSKDRLKRLMRSLTVGEIQPRPEDWMTLSDCLQFTYHRCLRHHVILVYAKDILIIDLHINMTVGVVPIDRTASPLVQVLSTRQRDVLYCLHDNGSISVKWRRQFLSHSSTVATTPMVDIMSDSQSSRISEVNLNHDNSSDLCIWYEQIAHCDFIRQTKGLKVMGMALCPLTENKISLLMNSGKLAFFELDRNYPFDNKIPRQCQTLSDLIPPSTYDKGSTANLRLATTGIIQNSSTQMTTIRMCPPLTNRNFLNYNPLLAAGSLSGHIFLFNMALARLERQYPVHSGPVRGIEWIDLFSFVSWSYTLSTNSNTSHVRNEVSLTDTRLNFSLPFRECTIEEPYIDILEISPLKQYLIIILKDGPFELWDIKRLQLLRILPKKFPLVTALAWSNANTKNKKSKSRRSEERVKNSDVRKSRSPEEKIVGEDSKEYNSDGSEKPSISKARKDSEEMLYKTRLAEEQSWSELQTPGGSLDDDFIVPIPEHVVFTDADSQLYYFKVEGNVLRDGIKIPPEENAKRVISIALKNNHIVQAQLDGWLNIWDLKAKKSKNKDLGRRWIRKMRFGPGQDNLKLFILFSDGADIIDLSLDQPEKVAQLKCPKEIMKIMDIDWAGPKLPVVITEDGTILIFDETLTFSASPLQKYTFQINTHLPNPLSKQELDTMLFHLSYGLLSQYEVTPVRTNIQTKLDLLGIDEILITRLEICDRFATVAILLGDKHLYSLWTLVKYYASAARQKSTVSSPEYFLENKKINKYPTVKSLETCYDVLCDAYNYQKLELERSSLHESKRGNYKHTQTVIERLILLGETDRAVQLLLETQISNENYYTDVIKACLVSTIQSTSAAQSTIKLVATNLIANERVWEGVQLLCLINKGLDACKYLISYNLWDSAVWLSKAILSDSGMNDIYSKWAQHLDSQGYWDKALLVYISLCQFEAGLELLLERNEEVLACLLMSVCDEYKLNIDPNIREKIQTYNENMLNSSNVDSTQVLSGDSQ